MTYNFKLLSIGCLVGFVFAGCSFTGVNTDIEKNNSVQKSLTSKDVIKIRFNNVAENIISKNIFLNKNACGDVNLVDVETNQEILKITSSVSDNLEVLNKIDTKDVVSGLEYKIDYCKLGITEMKVDLNIKLYNKSITLISGPNDKLISSTYNPEEYQHKSSLRLIKDTPITFGNFSLEWTTVVE